MICIFHAIGIILNVTFFLCIWTGTLFAN